MTNQKRLQSIRARCVELLAIAEKRSRGEWGWQIYDVGASEQEARVFLPSSDSSRQWQRTTLATTERHNVQDATFIASCAGNAEAGWRATIAAIDGLTCVIQGIQGRGVHFAGGAKNDAQKAIESIIAAWPEELL